MSKCVAFAESHTTVSFTSFHDHFLGQILPGAQLEVNARSFPPSIFLLGAHHPLKYKIISLLSCSNSEPSEEGACVAIDSVVGLSQKCFTNRKTGGSDPP